jgi:hypothetical protein
VYFGGRTLLGVHTVRAGADPAPLPEQGFSHGPLGRVLRRHVHGGSVDYAGLRQGDRPLRRYAARLARTGPRTAPGRFPSRDARLAYHINAYNALTLLGVLAHWPVDSVHDVRGPIEPTPGFGFFWAQRVRLDGRTTNLYDLEHEVLRGQFDDARIHAAINCASVSCPDLRGEPYVRERLDSQLDEATRAFCSQPRHVRIDAGRERIVLSAIFDWFRDDFAAHARRIGAGEGMLDFVEHFARPDVSEALRQARENGYEVTFAEYDWSLNRATNR